MTRQHKPPFSWTAVGFGLCAVYWLYLCFVTEMLVLHDAMGYESLGQLLAAGQWKEYFTTGPNREPLYPLFVSLAMHIGNAFSVSYQTVLKLSQFALLAVTQILVLKILDRLNIKEGLKAFAVIYIGFSPALVNSALSLFSEIIAFPLILTAVLLMDKTWCAFPNQDRKETMLSALWLASVFLLLTFAKGIFELIAPLVIVLFLTLRSVDKKSRPNMLPFAAVFAVMFFLPVLGYKMLNNTYNGNFVLTNRGSAAFYSNTVRAMDTLDPGRIKAALSYVPDGSGQFCREIAGSDDCTFWSYQRSDAISTEKMNELISRGVQDNEQNRTLMSLAVKEILKNPLQYLILRLVEGAKLFFWESTRIGFVVYPDWINGLYKNALLDRALVWAAGVFSALAFLYAGAMTWNNRRTLLSSGTGPSAVMTVYCSFLIILTYTAAHSLFLILTRYALPLAALHVILVVFLLNELTDRKPK